MNHRRRVPYVERVYVDSMRYRKALPASTDREISKEPSPAPVASIQRPTTEGVSTQIARTAQSSRASKLVIDTLSSARAHLPRRTQHTQPLRIKKSLKRKIKTSLVYGMTASMVVIGVWVTVQGALLNQQLKEQVRVLSASVSSDTTDEEDKAGQVPQAERSSTVPSETKPAQNYLEMYKVASELPRLISIPALGVKARVLQVGVDGNNELLTPKSIYDTAWYTASVKPGEPGTAIIDGHYVGPTTKGVFSRINTLKTGDTVAIERGDGQKITFRVTGVETVPVEQMDMMKVLAPNDKQSPKLNLITCGGSYDAKTFHFSHRTIVYTTLEG